MKTISNLYPYHAETKNTTMPFITAAASVPVIATAVWTGVAAVLVNQPNIGDIWAVLGAGLGAICALIEARANNRTIWETLSVFVGSSAIGSFGPAILYGAMFWIGWISPELESVITWQWWSAAGFFFALNAWLIIHRVNKRILAAIDERCRNAMHPYKPRRNSLPTETRQFDEYE